MARTAFDNGGFGLSVAEAWLDGALAVIAERGQTALEIAASSLLRSVDDEHLRVWVIDRISRAHASPVSILHDLDV